MESNEQKLYERLIDWLKKAWWDLPEAEELLPLMQARYTPEEAELLTGMPFSGKNIEELSQIKGMDPEELSPKMESLAKKGVVYRKIKRDMVHYSLNDSFFVFLRSAFWHGRDDEDTKKIAALANRYYYDGIFDQYANTDAKGLRTLPIREAVDDTRSILPFEDVLEVLETKQYFMVSVCPCKHRKNIDPDSPDCIYPTEVCLHFDDLGRYLVENDLGREITLDEARDILHKSADVGLVHAISNWKERVDTICNCCKCCCMWFEAYHKLGHAKGMSESNYQVQVNVESCKGCGLCVKRCPMEALKLEEFALTENKKERKVVIDSGRCIGCGVCAYKCPTNSLVLERREVITEPPDGPRELTKVFMHDRQAATNKT